MDALGLPPAPPATKRDQFAAERSLVVLYLNDGSVYAVTNCWVAGGKLHYEASYGGENSLELSALDLQRTVNANAARGVDFTLRPAPSARENAPQNPLPEKFTSSLASRGLRYSGVRWSAPPRFLLSSK